MIHFTNDAVQKKSDDYEKFEGGNKVILLNIDRFPTKISKNMSQIIKVT